MLARYMNGLLALALSAAALGAQQPASTTSRPATVVTFDEALKLALTQNTGVKQAQNSAALSGATVAQQKLAFLPSLSVSTNTAQAYGRNFSQTDGTILNTTTNTLKVLRNDLTTWANVP